MPPHCDTRDGPIVKAAKRALEMENINLILIWIPKSAEKELREAFGRALRIRRRGKDVQDLADDWFFETAVRLHRTGEGAPYTGLKPTGLDEGPIVPRAERAIDTGDPKDVISYVAQSVEKDLQKRFNDVVAKKRYDENNVEAGRAYVQAYINFVVYAHHLYEFIQSGMGHREETIQKHH